MIHINLLPIREIKRRNRAIRQVAFSAVAFVFFLAGLASFALYQFNYATALQKESDKLQFDIQQYTKILDEIKKIESDKKVLLTRIGIINQLKQSSSLTVHVLDEIASLTPPHRMWLTKLQQSGNELKLNGMALDDQTVAKYMDDVGNSPYMKNVILASASMEKYAERNLKLFSISCTVGVPVSAKNDQNLK